MWPAANRCRSRSGPRSAAPSRSPPRHRGCCRLPCSWPTTARSGPPARSCRQAPPCGPSPTCRPAMCCRRMYSPVVCRFRHRPPVTSPVPWPLPRSRSRPAPACRSARSGSAMCRCSRSWRWTPVCSRAASSSTTWWAAMASRWSRARTWTWRCHCCRSTVRPRVRWPRVPILTMPCRSGCHRCSRTIRRAARSFCARAPGCH
ncbi:hypothetical protein D3C71_1135590 [compost metagenome]